MTSCPEDDFEPCEDCPPVGYPTDKTRCIACPRRATDHIGDVNEMIQPLSKSLRDQLRAIVHGAMNSAIPEEWDVENHAVDAILALFAPQVEEKQGISSSQEPSPPASSALEAVAQAWASIDGKLRLYLEDDGRDRLAGYRDGYQADAAEMIARLAKRGYALMPLMLTPEMAHALESNFAECLPPSEVHVANWRDAYAAMLAASSAKPVADSVPGMDQNPSQPLLHNEGEGPSAAPAIEPDKAVVLGGRSLGDIGGGGVT